MPDGYETRNSPGEDDGPDLRWFARQIKWLQDVIDRAVFGEGWVPIFKLITIAAVVLLAYTWIWLVTHGVELSTRSRRRRCVSFPDEHRRLHTTIGYLPPCWSGREWSGGDTVPRSVTW